MTCDRQAIKGILCHVVTPVMGARYMPSTCDTNNEDRKLTTSVVSVIYMATAVPKSSDLPWSCCADRDYSKTCHGIH